MLSTKRRSRVVGTRRATMAQAAVRLIGSTISASSPLEITVGGDGPATAPIGPSSTDPVRVVFRDPGAVGRLLLPPTPARLADGYLRGEVDIQGDVLTAVGA